MFNHIPVKNYNHCITLIEVTSWMIRIFKLKACPRTRCGKQFPDPKLLITYSEKCKWLMWWMGKSQDPKKYILHYHFLPACSVPLWTSLSKVSLGLSNPPSVFHCCKTSQMKYHLILVASGKYQRFQIILYTSNSLSSIRIWFPF